MYITIYILYHFNIKPKMFLPPKFFQKEKIKIYFVRHLPKYSVIYKINI